MTKLTIRIATFCLVNTLVIGAVSSAQSADSGGVAIDGALGISNAIIENSDGEKAYYDGVGFLGRIHVPMVEKSKFGLDFLVSAKYLDFKNSANEKGLQEFGQHVGLGPGVEMRVKWFVAGAEYHIMAARHNTVGNVSSLLEFQFPTTTIYYGIVIQRSFLAFSLTGSNTTGVIPADQTHLSADAPYADQTVWLHFRYSTGFGLVQFFKALFTGKQN